MSNLEFDTFNWMRNWCIDKEFSNTLFLIFALTNHAFDKFNQNNIYLHYTLMLYFYIVHTNKYVQCTNYYTSITYQYILILGYFGLDHMMVKKSIS